jgi:hypothetical protein
MSRGFTHNEGSHPPPNLSDSPVEPPSSVWFRSAMPGMARRRD